MADTAAGFVDRLALAPARRPSDSLDETPEQAAQRVVDLQKRATAMFTEILLAYKIDPAPDWKQKEVIEQASAAIATKWTPLKLPDRRWDDAQVAAVKEVIATSAKDYLEGFCLQKAALANPQPEAGYEAYSKGRAAPYQIKIYMNHITNAAEARLIATGMDAITAHAINRYMIGATVRIAQEKGLNSDAHLLPGLPHAPESPQAWAKEVGFVRHYWEGRARELEAAVKAGASR